MMTLRQDWRAILRKAWSIRLMLLAGLLTGCEAILPLFVADLPRNLFAAASLIVITAALVARIVAQRDMRDD